MEICRQEEKTGNEDRTQTEEGKKTKEKIHGSQRVTEKVSQERMKREAKE
jgi:hypothetical protein